MRRCPAMTDDVYTHGHHESVLRSHRWRTAENSAAYLLPHLAAGDRLLDIGCGPGTITVDLAAAVAPASRSASTSPTTSSPRPPGRPRQPGCANVTFARGDAYGIDAADGTFDVVHAHQVLQHLGDPIAALTEMRRVLRPGGLLAVRDSDYGAFVWSPATTGSTAGCSCTTGSPSATVPRPTPGAGCRPGCGRPGSPTSRCPARRGRSPIPPTASWWGELWADRVVSSSFATQAKEYGLSDDAELDDLAAAFETWAADARTACSSSSTSRCSPAPRPDSDRFPGCAVSRRRRRRARGRRAARRPTAARGHRRRRRCRARRCRCTG